MADWAKSPMVGLFFKLTFVEDWVSSKLEGLIIWSFARRNMQNEGHFRDKHFLKVGNLQDKQSKEEVLSKMTFPKMGTS